MAEVWPREALETSWGRFSSTRVMAGEIGVQIMSPREDAGAGGTQQDPEERVLGSQKSVKRNEGMK